MKYKKLISALIDGSTLFSSFEFIKNDGKKLYGDGVKCELVHLERYKARMIVSCTDAVNKDAVIKWFKRYCSHAVLENTFATGATSQLVNELILFTNNDQELVKERDNIYDMYREAASDGWEKGMKFRLLNTLFYKASNKYLDTHTGEEYSNMQLITVQEQEEYVQVYINNLENWKIANPIKKRP